MRLALPILAAATLTAADAAAQPAPLAVAVLGDSDSHSYRDSVNRIHRGGANNAKTFNWIEVWRRLEPEEIDPGPFARAGDGRAMARLKETFGAPTRTPAKLDYLYDYAWSGARCASLMDDWPEQGRRFLARLKAEPRRWAEGLVVIRIGVNDFGQGEHLRQWAQAPESAEPLVDHCLADIGEAVGAIRKVSSVHIALVGIAHDYDSPFADASVVADADVASVEVALARFDKGLEALANADPRTAFIDDRNWFQRRFGSRLNRTLAENAKVAGLSVANAVGDDAAHLHTMDEHAGTVASGLFLQALIARLNEKFGWRLSVPSDAEIVALAK